MTHLETAFHLGVQKALEDAGYKTAADLTAELFRLEKVALALIHPSLEHLFARTALGAGTGLVSGAIGAGEGHREEGALRGLLGGGAGGALGGVLAPNIAYNAMGRAGINPSAIGGTIGGGALGGYLAGHSAHEKPLLDRARQSISDFIAP